jgi:hypothetical protein
MQDDEPITPADVPEGDTPADPTTPADVPEGDTPADPEAPADDAEDDGDDDVAAEKAGITMTPDPQNRGSVILSAWPQGRAKTKAVKAAIEAARQG